MYCPFCGEGLLPNQTYCPKCGARITSNPTDPPQTATPQYIYPSSPAPRTVKLSHFGLVVGILTILLLFTAGTLLLQVSQLETQLQHPTLEIWNSCGTQCIMSANSWRAGGVPDTFDYYVSFNATTPVTVYFFTLTQYVQFASCGRPSCVTGTYQSITATTSITNSLFNLAEGCASYVAVYQSTQNGVIYPDVRATYNPASSVTGACA